MAAPGGWIPARWSGDARALERIRGGPVTCLVVDWPAGAEHARRAKEAGVAVAGDLGGAKDARAAAASAKAAGLDAAIGPAGIHDDFVIPAGSIAEIPRGAGAGAAVVRGCIWPGIRMGKGAGADAGPTGTPWIDSNGWAARLARALAPGRSAWLDFGPPEKAAVTPEQWLLAAADACAHGARWLLPAEALGPDAWPAVSRALAFFAGHRAWPATPVSPVAATSDFAGPNEFLAHEFLNLSARKQLPVRILEKSRAAAAPWSGVRSLVYLDQDAPDARLAARMMEAARAGALVIAPANCAAFLRGAYAGEPPCPGYRMVAIGKGRAAIAAAPWDDPFLLAADVLNLAGRREAPVRLWNAANAIPYPVGAGEGSRPSVVHLLNYSSRGEPITVGVPGRYQGAAFYTPQAAGPVKLEAHAARYGVEFHLPEFPAYGAVVLEG